MKLCQTRKMSLMNFKQKQKRQIAFCLQPTQIGKEKQFLGISPTSWDLTQIQNAELSSTKFRRTLLKMQLTTQEQSICNLLTHSRQEGFWIVLLVIRFLQSFAKKSNQNFQQVVFSQLHSNLLLREKERFKTLFQRNIGLCRQYSTKLATSSTSKRT